jgi:TPR repeat protein
MAENTKPTQARDPFDRFDEAISDPRLYEADQSRYQQLREQLRYEPQTQYEQPQYERPQYEQPFALSVEPPEELPPHEAVPLFLANYEEESHQQLSEYAFGGNRRFGSGGLKKARAGRIVTGVVVVSAIAAVLALFSIDSTRAVIFNASLGGGGGGSPPSAQLAAAMPEPAQPQRIAAPPLAAEPTGAEVATARRTSPSALASASPTRDEIAAAYQSALKGKVAVPEPVARDAAREVAAVVPAAPVVAAVAPAVREPVPVTREAAPARRIDPDELEALLKRAKGLLAIGDITSARLLLERAADAQEAEAALMLAGTYDPQVLGSQDLRSVSPDPAAARVWYQKAAQLGSADAKRRLGQLQN